MNDPLGLTPQQRRAAEEQLRARYESEVLRTIELTADDRTLWPVRPGRAQLFESMSGAFAEELLLEGSFPDTRFVLVYRHQLRPGHRFALRWRVWGDPSSQDEPAYDDLFTVHLREDIFQAIGRAQPLA
ncbi:MAG TPA: hypothetical protein VN635_03855 [Conexibacter sp.]|nr:hypothetical protein [Conexibacter sp.]